MRRALPLALLLALAACTPDFESASIVKDLRVLAIAADPPEAGVDLAAGTVDDVRVTVLFADPAAPAAQRASVRAEACFPTDSGLCRPPSLPLASAASAPIGEYAFDVRVPAGLVAGAIADDRLKGLGGVQVQVSVEVDTADPAGPQAARKLLVYTPKDGHVPNHAPVLTGLELRKGTVVTGTWVPGQTLQLTVGEDVGLRPRPGIENVEVYEVTDLNGKRVTLRENVRHSFYVTPTGDLDRGSFDEPLPGVADPPEGFTRLRALKPGGGTLWVVTRDGRGGTAWLVVPWVAARQ